MMTGIIEVDGKEAESASLIFELADLRLENRRLRAELKTGNDALEDENEDLGRINDALIAENAELRAEVRKNIPAMKDAAKVITELRAELAAIKPDWSSAPKWAARHIIKSFYLDEFNETGNPTRIVEARPEET